MCEHTFDMIVCVQIPRFELAIAAGGREALAAGPVALAPEAGREQLIGQASAAAEAYGVRAGLRLGEALARCPALRLVPPDPAGVADEWERLLVLLEGIGAAVEPGRPGLAWFDAEGLRTLHGGSLEGVIGAARRALAVPVRLGAAPARFAALAASSAARARRAEIAPSGAASLRAYLAPLPVALLGVREETAALPPVLERFGVRTLGELAKMPRAALADRFGEAGVRARALARGRDTPLRPRTASERLEERLELPESASGSQLERALGLLIDRLLARRERRGRTLRSVVLSARLVEGGTWRERVVFREPLADPVRMRLVLGGRLGLLPAPAETLRLAVERFGPPSQGDRALFDDAEAQRSARLREAVRQTRAVAGPESALRVLSIDPDSRVPERRAVLTPFEP
jgi:nucleotidyltransferase/DNA polymerase involved in DNA repair